MSALAQSKVDIAPRSFMESIRNKCGLGGLIAKSPEQEVAFPLQEVKVRVSIAGNCCRAVIDQRFKNPLKVGMEAVHIFPLPEDGAVNEVELRCGDIIVKAECKEKEEAQEEFNQARQQGHRAALLTQERDDVHTLNVTNIPPGEEVTVRIVVVEKLEIIDGEYRFRFPTTIAPRYLPGNPISHEGPGANPDTDRVTDASRLQPPLRLEGGTKLDLEVELAAPVHNLSSSLHAVRMGIDGGGIKVAPSTKATLNKDFILSFSTGDDQEASLRAWTDGNYTLAVVEPPLKKISDSVPRDAVFVVDISGSMSGAKLDAAKKALITAVHGLLPGDRFKLVAFDDRIELFKKDFVDFNDQTLAAADKWIDNLRARGGTEMLPAIKESLSGNTLKGRLRTVLFVTDGQAWNEKELCAAIAYRRKRSRFFTVGIDTAVNGALLKSMARAGGGTCELATPHDDIEEIMSKIEARFGSPVATEIRFTGGTPGRDEELALFSGRPVTLMLKGTPDLVKVTGQVAGGEMNYEVRPAKVNFPLGALWARERIQFLEDRLKLNPFEEESIKHHILEAALEHGIASKYTSFVAVERSTTLEGDRVSVVQPNELPEAWDKENAVNAVGGSAPGAFSAPPSPSPRRRLSESAPNADMAKLRKVKKKPSAGKSGKKGLMSHFKDLISPTKKESQDIDRCEEKSRDISEGQGGLGRTAASSSSDPFAAPSSNPYGQAGSDTFSAPMGAAAPSSDPFAAPGSPAGPGASDPFGLGGGNRSAGSPPPPPASMAAPMESFAEDDDDESGDFQAAKAFMDVSDDADDGDFMDDASLSVKSYAPPAPSAPAPAPAPAAAAPAHLHESGDLARSQDASGAFGGDVDQTIAAVLALILMGHTRRKGLRRRAVLKAAKWLEAQGREGGVDWVLTILEKAEAGEDIKPDKGWDYFAVESHGPGKALKLLLA
ncbi:MAG: VIT domain-containing protein [Planctomycetota bacterium]|nr:VIT domain-containing protein [Planctomycetota bacterium]